jgi:DtxR family transcriptional regulator, Mn-dependent transcriptional regulator
VSAPTALEMIRRLRTLGFVEADSVALTPAGQSAALVLGSRRAAAHTLVHDVLGVDDERSRAEADHLATAVSPALGRRLLAERGRPPKPRGAR